MLGVWFCKADRFIGVVGMEAALREELRADEQIALSEQKSALWTRFGGLNRRRKSER